MRVSVAEEADERRVLTQMLFTMALGSRGFSLGPTNCSGDVTSELGCLVEPPRGVSPRPAVRVLELDDSAGLSPWATGLLLPASPIPALGSLHFARTGRDWLASAGNGRQHQGGLSPSRCPNYLRALRASRSRSARWRITLCIGISAPSGR